MFLYFIKLIPIETNAIYIIIGKAAGFSEIYFHTSYCKINFQNNLACKIVPRKLSQNKPGTSFSQINNQEKIRRRDISVNKL